MIIISNNNNNNNINYFLGNKGDEDRPMPGGPVKKILSRKNDLENNPQKIIYLFDAFFAFLPQR